ncbi:MAG: DUF1801 domain-containing protein [Candidatus Eremiobacteraeota bacterium]|nr:DUF1801 domain-containing protein [Candidatus Eremiobacteraeota bacterium]
MRSTIREAMPQAEEVISYRIPAYTLHGVPVLYFAGWKRHFSLYPATAGIVAEFKDELAPYEVSKGTIRFPLAQPVPANLVERIAKFRVAEVAARDNARPTHERGASAGMMGPFRRKRGIPPSWAGRRSFRSSGRRLRGDKTALHGAAVRGALS